MPNKAIHQLAFTGTREATDVVYIVRSGADYQLPLDAMIPALSNQTTVIPSADVLTLNGTPFQVVDDAPAGYVNIPVRAIVQFSGGTSDYATNTTLLIGATGQVSDTDYTLSTSIADRTNPINAINIASGTNPDGSGLSAYVQTGNPTAGDSDLTVTTWYYQQPLP